MGELKMLKKALALFFVLLMIVGVAHAQDGSKLPPAPGDLVDVGGYKLHIYCMGEGSPTVIMDAGIPDWSLHLRAVQESISEFTRVCAFDRAGYGWSEAGSEPRTSQQIVDELKALLDNGMIEGPYVLVGHSFGGLNMILFANENPDQVAGVVLVDSSHPDQLERLAAVPELIALQDAEIEAYKALEEQVKQGQIKAEDVLPMAPEGIAEDLRPAWAELFIQPKNLEASVLEYASLADSAAQVKENGTLGDIPLVVIAHGMATADSLPPEALEQLGITRETLDTFDTIWRELQEDHLTRSTQSTLVIAENSTHYVYLSEPELVVDAIRGLVGAEQ
jgi:pimeloyl-ACP methyl ester carboxylesterase